MPIIDKNIKFVVENYDEIISLQEIVKHARKNIPDWLNKTFQQSLNEMDEFFDQQGLRTETVSGDTIYWYDPKIYDIDKGVGFFFSFEEDNWDYIFDGNTFDKNRAASIYVAVDLEGGKKKQNDLFNKIIKKIDNQKNTNVFKKNKISICKEFEFDDEIIILQYSLSHDINMKKLINSDDLTMTIQDAIKKFTCATQPIISQLSCK